MEFHVSYGVALAVTTIVSWRIGGDRLFLCSMLWFNWLFTNAAAFSIYQYYPAPLMFVVDASTAALLIMATLFDIPTPRARWIMWSYVSLLPYDLAAMWVDSLTLSPALDWLRYYGYMQMLMVIGIPNRKFSHE